MLRAKAKWELGRSRVTILDLGVLKVSSHVILLTITYKSSLTQKKLYNKTDAIFSMYGKTGLTHDIFWILT